MNYSHFSPVPISSGVDLTSYSLGQLVYLLYLKKPIFAGALGSAVNKLKVVTVMPGNVTFPELLEAYKLKYKETQVIHPVQITDWAATNGIPITYNRDEIKAPELSKDAPATTKSTNAKPEIRETIVIDEIPLPLYNGVPIVTPESQVKLEAFIGKPVFATTKLDILVVKNVVDVVKVKDGVFCPKTFAANSLLTSNELKDSAFVVADYLHNTFGVMTDKLGKNCHFRGKALIQELFTLIARLPNKQDKIFFLKHIYDIFRSSKIFLNIKKVIGDHEIGSAGHAHAFYESSRSIRGADKTDSTSTGLSTYAPFDMNRQIMENLIIAKNFHNLSQVIDLASFNLIGKDAVKVITALMFVASSKIDKIGLPAAISGWKYGDDGFGHHANVSFRLTSIMNDATTIYLDEQATPNSDRSQVSASFFLNSAFKGVQSVHVGWATRDTNFKHFVPSVAVHSLKGFYLNLPMSKPLVDSKKYYTASVFVNRARVLPSFCNQRAWEILLDYDLQNMVLKANFVTVALKKASSIIAEEGVMSSYEDFSILLAQHTTISQEEFEASCSKAERETEEDASANDTNEEKQEATVQEVDEEEGQEGVANLDDDDFN